MSDGDVSVGRWPGARDDYGISVTATRRRDRGRKTLELRTFERNPTTGAWSADPGYRRIMLRVGITLRSVKLIAPISTSPSVAW